MGRHWFWFTKASLRWLSLSFLHCKSNEWINTYHRIWRERERKHTFDLFRVLKPKERTNFKMKKTQPTNEHARKENLEWPNHLCWSDGNEWIKKLIFFFCLFDNKCAFVCSRCPFHGEKPNHRERYRTKYKSAKLTFRTYCFRNGEIILYISICFKISFKSKGESEN